MILDNENVKFGKSDRQAPIGGKFYLTNEGVCKAKKVTFSLLS